MGNAAKSYQSKYNDEVHLHRCTVARQINCFSANDLHVSRVRTAKTDAKRKAKKKHPKIASIFYSLREAEGARGETVCKQPKRDKHRRAEVNCKQLDFFGASASSVHSRLHFNFTLFIRL